MNNLNSVLIDGNLTRDVEVKTFQNGTVVARLSVAVNRYVKKDAGYEQEVSYIDVTAFGKLAERVGEKGVKGAYARIIGRLKQERWNGSDGKAYSKVVIIADNVDLKAKEGAERSSTGGNNEPPDSFTDDIPF
jgi:single-strand DNA-binding protein